MNSSAAAWAGTADMFMCLFGVMLYTAQVEAKKNEGPKQPAAYLITAEWSVNKDADVDLWVREPDKTNVFYASRQRGCAALDIDNHGSQDSIITLTDGSQTKIKMSKETTALRCIEPGEWTVGVHLYNYRENGFPVSSGRSDLGVRVHVEIVGLNPEVRVMYAKDIVLNTKWQAENMTSFILSSDGALALTEAPIEPIVTSEYRNGMSATTAAPNSVP